jgi:hypothetical protein
MPEGMLEDMMAMHLAEGGGGGGGGAVPQEAGVMPGQMPGFEFLGEDMPGEFERREAEVEVDYELGIGDGDEDEDEDEEADEEEDEEDEEDVSVSFVVDASIALFLTRFFSRCRVF